MEIIFPDTTLLGLLEIQYAYYDKKSLEEKTKIIKPKYKLLRKKLPSPLDSFIFFVMTTNPNACERFLTLCIYQKDWENRKTGHLREKCSYLDIRKIEVIDKDTALWKMKDGDNKFLKVAKLSDNKFLEIKKLYKGSYQNPVIVSPEIKQLIEVALDEANIGESTLKKLGLS
jgi:hypothetical protein